MPTSNQPDHRPRRTTRPPVSPAGRRAAARRAAARRRQARVRLVVCLAAFALICASVLLLLNRPKPETAPAGNAGSDATVAAGADVSEPVSEATPDPAQARIDEATKQASANTTGTAPAVTDPDTWNQQGKDLMDRLCADQFYIDEGIDMTEKSGFPYLIAVNRAASTVTVYTLDEEGRYTVPYMAMVCSGGDDTPLGFFATPVDYPWRLLSGPCYGQYATRIWESYLFHSVPYYSQHKDDLEYDEYNQLGTPASLGCIRLAVADVKWIYDNCDLGTRVIIYDDESNPGPMGKPGTIHIDPADETLRGWDPTDPDPENPWDDQYLSGTAIRSQAAWDEWNAAQADGRWTGSLTPTDLQGYSTDSSIVGTRG
nr:L,D-transpeptidase family protein [uncultured Gemmiger sp.]